MFQLTQPHLLPPVRRIDLADQSQSRDLSRKMHLDLLPFCTSTRIGTHLSPQQPSTPTLSSACSVLRPRVLRASTAKRLGEEREPAEELEGFVRSSVVAQVLPVYSSTVRAAAERERGEGGEARGAAEARETSYASARAERCCRSQRRTFSMAQEDTLEQDESKVERERAWELVSRQLAAKELGQGLASLLPPYSTTGTMRSWDLIGRPLERRMVLAAAGFDSRGTFILSRLPEFGASASLLGRGARRAGPFSPRNQELCTAINVCFHFLHPHRLPQARLKVLPPFGAELLQDRCCLARVDSALISGTLEVGGKILFGEPSAEDGENLIPVESGGGGPKALGDYRGEGESAEMNEGGVGGVHELFCIV